MFDSEETVPSVNGSTVINNEPGSIRQPDKVAEISSVKVAPIGSLGALVLIATIIALVGAGGLFLYKTSRQSNLDTKMKQYQDLNTRLNSSDLKKLSADLQEIQDGKIALASALSDRVYWSKFWDKMSKVTPLTVSLNSMSIDSSNVVSISGMANDLTGIAKYMVSLQQSPLFSDIKLGNTSVKNTSGKNQTAFSITFKINPSELLNK